MEQFSNHIKLLSITEDQRAWLVQALKEVNHTQDSDVEERGVTLKTQISKLQKRLSSLYEDKLDGTISPAFYEMKSLEYERQM